MSHSAVSQGIIITHDDGLIKRAGWRLRIPMHFLPRHGGRVDGAPDVVSKQRSRSAVGGLQTPALTLPSTQGSRSTGLELR